MQSSLPPSHSLIASDDSDDQTNAITLFAFTIIIIAPFHVACWGTMDSEMLGRVPLSNSIVVADWDVFIRYNWRQIQKFDAVCQFHVSFFPLPRQTSPNYYLCDSQLIAVWQLDTTWCQNSHQTSSSVFRATLWLNVMHNNCVIWYDCCSNNSWIDVIITDCHRHRHLSTASHTHTCTNNNRCNQITITDSQWIVHSLSLLTDTP